MACRHIAVAFAIGVLLAPFAAQAQTKIKMGSVRSTVLGGV